MMLTITDCFGQRVSLKPRVELYRVHDFMGAKMPGLAIALYTVGTDAVEDEELYAVLTVLALGDNRHSGLGEKRQFRSTENSHLQFE